MARVNEQHMYNNVEQEESRSSFSCSILLKEKKSWLQEKKSDEKFFIIFITSSFLFARNTHKIIWLSFFFFTKCSLFIIIVSHFSNNLLRDDVMTPMTVIKLKINSGRIFCFFLPSSHDFVASTLWFDDDNNMNR